LTGRGRGHGDLVIARDPVIGRSKTLPLIHTEDTDPEGDLDAKLPVKTWGEMG
jgi:hypothetical protein